MRRTLVAFLLFLACALRPGPAALAQTDKPDPLLAQLEADFLAYWPKVEQFQSDYSLLHGGKYYQALDSYTTPPADGKLETPDKLQSGPTDQPEKADLLWAMAELPSKLAYSVRIDVYDGPEGRGYVVTLSAEVSGRRWERQLNTGPERWRDQPWFEVPPDQEAGTR